ncbi:DNA topoisomerase 1 [Pirellula sp. SH-Sr6A]|uniref:type I DNA topoisomerase n=1 Tax=Pirellula sp. SH-Sr6A TaxID=1632865 RepID=UPI00078CC83B|nr:type I DNA topoisomerase [Pirellula sp. SH-Sr6A]AMV32391.1 DNA topoisomerase 1 [Pirellula sp. SH-Sr6A]
MSEKKSLVIVESPAKAKTISKYLGSAFQVEASIGHIRDLPGGAKEVPAEFKSQSWASLGVNVDQGFEPLYVVPSDKKKHITHLKSALKDAQALYLATDEDREGEAISWHLKEVLKPKVPVHRMVFHEITKEAIQNALKSTRNIDEGLVKAQETRRILDRLYGYDISPLLWKKVRPGLSAGRVQSVAVRLIVERERERMAFHSATYFDLEAALQTRMQEKFSASLVSVAGRKIPSGKDFDPATGKIKDPQMLLLDEKDAEALKNRLMGTEFQVLNVEVKPYTERPKAPFTTSTMQQEANRKLGFTAKDTMRLAQSLYENGYITYMRTDSTTLSKEAVNAARELVRSQYGERFLYSSERTYATKVKNAQEAHEAIRPAGHPFQLPDALRRELSYDQFRLFELIWKRTIASQMADARKKRVVVTIAADDAIFQATGTSIEFEGFLRAYVEGSDDPAAELAEREKLLPDMRPEDLLKILDLESLSHTTQPPARFTEASLTQALEERGIGRPSTYASIIDTILRRDYVFKKGNALVPSWTAFAVIRLMEEHFSSLVDYQFTAEMEDYLDQISRNERENLAYLQEFYFGSDQVLEKLAPGGIGLKPLLEQKVAEIDPRTACSYPLPSDLSIDNPIVVRVGRYGPYIERGDQRASLPDDMAPDELTLDKAEELLAKQQQSEEPLGIHPETQKPIYIKQGRFGPYVQMGAADDEEKKNASLLRGMTVETLDLATAVKLLSLPRDLGPHPEDGEPVIATQGRFGPFLKHGSDSRSLPAGSNLLEITLDEALAILAQPKAPGRGRGVAAAPLKQLDESPVTGKKIELRDGRYGLYVTDGETNASLPKDQSGDDLTFEQAVELLAARAAAGGSKKKKTSKKTAKKATKKATTSKGTKAAKKTATKKAKATKKKVTPDE